jgi:hypothetical protein
VSRNVISGTFLEDVCCCENEVMLNKIAARVRRVFIG